MSLDEVMCHDRGTSSFRLKRFLSERRGSLTQTRRKIRPIYLFFGMILVACLGHHGSVHPVSWQSYFFSPNQCTNRCWYRRGPQDLPPPFREGSHRGKLGEVLAPGRKADGRIREGDETGAYQLLLL